MTIPLLSPTATTISAREGFPFSCYEFSIRRQIFGWIEINSSLAISWRDRTREISRIDAHNYADIVQKGKRSMISAPFRSHINLECNIDENLFALDSSTIVISQGLEVFTTCSIILMVHLTFLISHFADYQTCDFVSNITSDLLGYGNVIKLRRKCANCCWLTRCYW